MKRTEPTTALRGTALGLVLLGIALGAGTAAVLALIGAGLLMLVAHRRTGGTIMVPGSHEQSPQQQDLDHEQALLRIRSARAWEQSMPQAWPTTPEEDRRDLAMLKTLRRAGIGFTTRNRLPSGRHPTPEEVKEYRS